MSGVGYSGPLRGHPHAQWWRCPNDPPCKHGSALHDIEEYPGDGTDTCCVEGCECRGPEARRA